MTFKKSLLIALFSFGIAQSAFAETNREKFDRAVQFYEQQNYSAAFPLFKQLAEQGNASSQFNLGFMYEDGKGVAQTIHKLFTGTQKPLNKDTQKHNSISAMRITTAKALTKAINKPSIGTPKPLNRDTQTHNSISA